MMATKSPGFKNLLQDCHGYVIVTIEAKFSLDFSAGKYSD
jgi:hypothetical protein